MSSRYADLVRLLLRHARGDLLAGAQVDGLGGGDDLPEGSDARARAFAEDLESMGPTYIKLGQLLSTRFDLLPAAYTDALTRLQAAAPPMPARQTPVEPPSTSSRSAPSVPG